MSNSLVEQVQAKYLAYQEAVNKHNNSLNKLNFVYRKYVNMKENIMINLVELLLIIQVPNILLHHRVY